MPVDSKRLNSALQSQVFQVQATGFCKNWAMTARVNMMFHPMGWRGHHITCVQNEGEFLKQTLHIVRYRIGDFLCCRWNVNSRFNNQRRLGPSPYKQTVLGWSLEQQWFWTFSGNQCPEWDLSLLLAKTLLWKACPEIGRFLKQNPKRGWVGHLLPLAGGQMDRIGRAGNTTQCCPSFHQVPIVRSACPVLPVLFCLSCSACPNLPIQFCLSCSACSILLVLITTGQWWALKPWKYRFTLNLILFFLKCILALHFQK